MSPRRLFSAWIALLAFVLTFGLGAATEGHSGPEDDAACGPSGMVTGHPRTQFEGVKTSPAPTHCPFCHWQRVVSGASLASINTGLFLLEPIARVVPSSSRPVGSDVLDGRLSRGPPAQTQKA